MADASITQAIKYRRVNGEMVGKELVFTCTAATANTFTTASTDDGTGLHGRTISKEIFGWFVDQVTSNPGATAPTAGLNVTLADEDGVDVLDGNGAALVHNTTSKSTYPGCDGMAKRHLVTGALTLNPDAATANAQTVAVVVITVKFVRKVD